MKFLAAAAFAVAFLVVPARSQERVSAPPVVDLPRGPITRIQSPDRKWILVFECPNNCAERKLWIEDSQHHTRRLVSEYERSLDIGWAPNSTAFFVNDASASTDTRSYVYDALSLRRISLAQLLKNADPTSDDYIGAGHAYLEAERWVNSHEIIVRLYGHFDEQRRAFTLRYRLDLSGTARKIYKSAREEPQ